MSERDPRRLLDPGSELHPNLRALLAAGRAELPGPEQVAALARHAGPDFVGPTAQPALAGAGVGPVLSLVTLGLVLAGLGGAVYLAVEHAREADPPAPRMPSAVEVDVPLAKPVASQPPAPSMPGLEPPAPPARVSRPARDPARNAVRSATDPVAELTLLDEAQGALRTAPELALDRAATHAARFPRGQYAQEREIIAIEALLRLGRNRDAERRAARFVVRFPSSSYRARADQQREQARAALGGTP